MERPWVSDDEGALERAQRFLRTHPTLHDLLRAGGEVLDVVVQDEFTHDVVAQLPFRSGALLVVFDST